MKELNQEQHIQLLQFMSLMQNCKTEEEMQALKAQYYNIPHYSFLQEYISDKNKEQSLASYKTSLIYDMDKYQQDYKFVYGESFPVFKKESLPNKKADYTVLNLLDEINECNNIEEYQKLLNEYNKFPKAKIENLSSDYTGIFYFSGNKVTGLPSDIIPNSPESNFNARKHLVEAGYSLFNLPSVEDVKDNGFDWLQEEISYFKKSLNPNFIEMENQINTEAAFNESEYEKYFDDFTEQMDANEGMSSMAAEADYIAFQNEQEDIDDVQRQMDIDNGLIDENGNEILYDVPESETLEQNKENFNEVKNELNSQIQEVSLFDKELQEFIDGKLPKSHIFTLGKPSEILVKCGFPAEQRIELSASHLEFKSKLDWHPFELKDVMGLEKALKNPIAVFEYGDRKKSQNVIINIEKDGKNFLAGVHFNQEHNGFEISTIRTLFPKDTVEWLNWMNQGKMIYGNKEKLQALIAQQRINVADVNSQVVQSPLYEHCLESSSSILDKFGEVKDIFTDEYPFYKEVKKKAAIEQKFFNYYVTKGNLDSRELSVFESEEFYNALKSGNTQKIDEYTKTDLHEIKELAAEIYEEFSKEKEVGMTQNLSAVSQSEIDNPSSIIEPPSKVEDFVRNGSSEESETLEQNKEDFNEVKINNELNLNNVGQEKNMADSPEEKTEELTEEEFDKYIHSEEFISKFGDWEKVNRLEKLKESEPLIGSNSIIIEGVDVSDIVAKLRSNYSKENLKQLQNIARDAGREIIARLRKEQNIKAPNTPVLTNTDSGKEFKVQMTGINEIKNHNIFSKGHIEAISAIPELIKNGIYISSELNEDGRKPQYMKFHYFAYGYKLNNEDYTAKIVFTETKEGKLFYDQSLSAIEKGRLIDIIQKKNMLETVLLHIHEQDSSEQEEVLNPLISQENLDNHDKRLISICQVPQMPYLEKNVETGRWQPTKEAVRAVRNGTLFVEKQGQKYMMKFLRENNEKTEQDVPLKNIQSENGSKINSPALDIENVNSVQIDETEIESNTILGGNAQTRVNYSDKIYSAPRPQNMKELHEFFINNPYTAGTPVPTIALRNEQTGHSTFIEGYEFARFEDIGKENPAFKDENGNQIKPDGQTVVLTKPGFREEINNETGEKELVPDEDKRKFIRISRDLYEQTLKNSEIIAERNPKTNEEHLKMIDDYLEAANLDEKKQRANTASNFWHNYQAGVMTLANNKQEAMSFAKRLVNEMIPSERKKFAAMVKNYEKIRGADGKHLSYDQRILERYEDITKGLQITNKSIWRDHVDKKYDTLETIKQNTEVFDIEGQSLDKTCRMKIGDTIKMSVTVDSALSNKKIKLPPQEYKLVAHSKDNNSVALISVDGKQKIIKNRDDFIKEVQKVEKKLIKKQQKQDRYESISM